MKRASLTPRRVRSFGVALICAVAGASLWAAPALANAPWWRLSARPAPTYLEAGHEARIIVGASNVGNQGTSGAIEIKDALPPTLKATAVRMHQELGGALERSEEETLEHECTKRFEENKPASEREPSCTWPKSIRPYERLEFEITVTVAGNATSGETNSATVSGGGAEPVSLSRPLRVAGPGEPTPFGVEKWELDPEEEGGQPDAQAGSTPYQLTNELDFNQILEAYPAFGRGILPSAPALARDLSFKLPPGLLGNVNSLPQCSDTAFSTIVPNTQSANACPSNTAIGVAAVTLNEPNNNPGFTRTVPVFNLAPARGEPARFGFEVFRVPVILNTAVLTSGEYNVVVSTTDTTALGQVLSTQVTFWGEPGAESHDASRGWECVVGGKWEEGTGKSKTSCPPEQRPTSPFLRLPTSCGPMETTVEGNSWPTSTAPNGLTLLQPQPLPGDFTFQDNLVGCEGLPFSPSLEVQPQTTEANTPVGVTVKVHIPQQTSLELGRGGHYESDVRNTTLTLPQGMLLNPAAADGLLACSFVSEAGRPEGQIALHSSAPITCPSASKVGNVRVKSPFLPKLGEEEGKPVFEELEGGVYLAAQNENPFGSLIAMYIVGETPVSHVLVKLAGEVKLDPNTGQITSTFLNTPQLPFEDLEVELFGGPRASLTTPPVCGEYTTTASFTSWGGNVHNASSTFSTGPCQNQQPFAPSFQAGTTITQARAFTPFVLTIKRPDSDQQLSSLSMQLPTGLAAIIANVTPCPEPQAAEGTCGPESLIGHATSSTGLGSDPFSLVGSVYLTKGFDGAPFGISIVTPANAGPFHLGNVVVRSTIRVDPFTAAVTISGAVPTMVNTVGPGAQGQTGLPVQLKETHVVVDRPNFQFNPTNCTRTAITATFGGAAGGSSTASVPYQATGCQNLSFKPTFEASAGGHGSKANGTSLTVKVTSGPGQANIGKTNLTLPVELPSRLSTIQKACLEKTFEANPATCPEGSVIGTATIHTPVFKNPFNGPAYLVSHGNAAFPDVEFVLQGEGITIILDGKTDIKKGITYSRFESLPDAPVSMFETTLPAGPHSALTTNVPEKLNYSLCGKKLVMPTILTGQNGDVVNQSTVVKITGCGKPTLTRAQRLAKALKACRAKFHGKAKRKKRAACERAARKKYGSAAKHTTKHKKKK